MLKIVYAISLISGTIIGVGLFALPFLTLKVGFWIILVYFAVAGTISILIHYFLGEVSLQTPDFVRIPGFAKTYLGNWGYRVALFSGISGMFGACLAYLLVGGEFLGAMLAPIFGGGDNFYTLIYFAAGALLVFWGIRAIEKVQFWGLILFLLTLIGIFFRGWEHLSLANLSISQIDSSYLFLPYGVILFSLWGLPLIPEAEELLGSRRMALRKIIPLAIIIPAVIYLLFIFLVLGITGEATTTSALTGLQGLFGNGVTAMILFFGVITTFTSFIALGLTLKKIFWYDLEVKKNLSWLIACFVPLLFFLAGFKDFIIVIGFVGAVALAIDGILVLLMYQKIKPGKLKIVTYPLIFALALGMVYELVYILI